MFAKSIILSLATIAQAAHLVDYDSMLPAMRVVRQEAGHINNYTYTGGSTGPMNWANLQGWHNNANRVCATGRVQSPINIDSSIGAGNAPTINYPNGRQYTLQNVGTTLEAITTNRDGLTVTQNGGRVFTFNNFHFHTPSEHRINDESFPLEMHIVNSAPATASLPANNLVLTLLFSLGTSDNAFIASILTAAPNARTPGTSGQTSQVSWDAVRSAFASSAPRKVYNGSLTTPPCTENTQFVIATTPLTISVAQYAQIKQIIKFNSRYTQNTLGQGNLLQIRQPAA